MNVAIYNLFDYENNEHYINIERGVHYEKR